MMGLPILANVTCKTQVTEYGLELEPAVVELDHGGRTAVTVPSLCAASVTVAGEATPALQPVHAPNRLRCAADKPKASRYRRAYSGACSAVRPIRTGVITESTIASDASTS
ncbi:MAG: hypothetical protein M3169_11950, partial [Candidatus Eremiobacteraeota bacterium]|nr:hypothetical protein [Candidatus Eremiobacteraeota bacterium]